MSKATVTLIAAAAALLASSAFAQSNNTLATPTTRSPAAEATSGYGMPGASSSDSGTATPGSMQSNGTEARFTPPLPAYGVNNTLARPTTKSPVDQ